MTRINRPYDGWPVEISEEPNLGFIFAEYTDITPGKLIAEEVTVLSGPLKGYYKKDGTFEELFFGNEELAEIASKTEVSLKIVPDWFRKYLQEQGLIE